MDLFGIFHNNKAFSKRDIGKVDDAHESKTFFAQQPIQDNKKIKVVKGYIYG